MGKVIGIDLAPEFVRRRNGWQSCESHRKTPRACGRPEIVAFSDDGERLVASRPSARRLPIRADFFAVKRLVAAL